MAIPEHLEEATGRYAAALADVHQATNESVHEKLHAPTWKTDRGGAV